MSSPDLVKLPFTIGPIDSDIRIDCPALADNGCTRSLFRRSVFLDAGINMIREGEIIVDSAFRKAERFPRYLAKVHLELDGVSKVCEVYCVDSLTQPLIGKDLLKLFQLDCPMEGYVRCRLNGKKYYGKIRKENLKVYDVKPSDSSGRKAKSSQSVKALLSVTEKVVPPRPKFSGLKTHHIFRLQKDVTIPEKSSAHVKVFCTSRNCKEVEIYTLTPPRLCYGKIVKAPSTLTTNKSGGLILTNFNSSPITLRKGENRSLWP